MTWSVLAIQALNGLQYGVLLFLLAAGLTLVLGIMNFVNLAHGSLYMLGAYLGASVYTSSGSFLLAGVAAVAGTLLIGVVLLLLAGNLLALAPALADRRAGRVQSDADRAITEDRRLLDQLFWLATTASSAQLPSQSL